MRAAAQRLNFARSSGGSPNSSQMTASGNGRAKCSTRSTPPRRADRLPAQAFERLVGQRLQSRPQGLDGLSLERQLDQAAQTAVVGLVAQQHVRPQRSQIPRQPTNDSSHQLVACRGRTLHELVMVAQQLVNGIVGRGQANLAKDGQADANHRPCPRISARVANGSCLNRCERTSRRTSGGSQAFMLDTIRFNPWDSAWPSGSLQDCRRWPRNEHNALGLEAANSGVEANHDQSAATAEPGSPRDAAAERRDSASLAQTGTVPNGLSSAEVQRHREQFGYNELPEQKVNQALKFLLSFWGPIPWMIEIAVVLSAIVGHWADFGIILTLLVANAIVGFWEEYQAGNAIAALKATLALKAKVKRDGNWTAIAARELVPCWGGHIRANDIWPLNRRGLTARAGRGAWNRSASALRPLRPRRRTHSRSRLANERLFFRVKLVEQPPGPQIERTPRLLVGRGLLPAVVKTPAGGSSSNSAFEIGQKIGGRRLPGGIAPAKRLLVMDRRNAAEFLCHRQALARAALGLARRIGIPRPMWTEEIELGRHQRVAHVPIAEIVPAERSGHESSRVEPADQRPQLLELERHESIVSHVPFVRQIEIPVAMWPQRRDDGFDGPLVRP